MHDIEKLKHVPIEDVARKLGMKVGRGHQALCPFHADKVASLHFGRDRRHWKCFACGKYGDQISLVMDYLALPFVKACEWLEKEMMVTAHSITVTPHECTGRKRQQLECKPDREYLEWLTQTPRLTEAARHFLFEERKLDPKVVEQLGLTSTDSPLPCTRCGCDFYDAPSLLIPYRDRQGKLLTVQGRRLAPLTAPLTAPLPPGGGLGNEADAQQIPPPGGGGATPRFRFPPGSHCPVYNLPVLDCLGEGEELWIAEGCSDCWALLSSGRKAIAIPSATLLTARDIEPLKGLNLHMAPDNDSAGRRLFGQIKQLLPQTVLHELPEGVKDFGEFYRMI